MKDRKLLAVDLDGTLLAEGSVLTENTYNKICEMVSKGHLFMIATGRAFMGAKQISDKFNFDISIAAFNGSFISSSISNSVINDQHINKKSFRILYDLAIKNDYPFIFYCNDNLYINRDDDITKKYYNVSSLKPKILDPLNIDNYNVSKMIILTYEIKNPPYDLFDKLPKIDYYYSNPYFLEFVPHGVNKGESVKKVAKKFKIKRKNVICCGDEENDISMIKYAGIGVAMENSKDIVKKASDIITSSNNDDGVSKIIDKLILN